MKAGDDTLCFHASLHMQFQSHHSPAASRFPDDHCIVSLGDRLLVADADTTPRLPRRSELTTDETTHTQLTEFCVGTLGEEACWALGIPTGKEVPGAPAGLEWHELRAVTARMKPGVFQAVAHTRELLWWRKRNQYCGCCGQPTREAETERALVCTSCKTTTYPVIAPAVIVAIKRGDTLLLAHNKNFRPGLHSLIAGFVDPGETLEQCVRREAFEETGLRVGNLHYISSQPWPYPVSLMLGFSADYESGELTVDGQEIEYAGWFTKDALPEIPGPGTVARLLIDAWLRGEL